MMYYKFINKIEENGEDTYIYSGKEEEKEKR